MHTHTPSFSLRAQRVRPQSLRRVSPSAATPPLSQFLELPAHSSDGALRRFLPPPPRSLSHSSLVHHPQANRSPTLAASMELSADSVSRRPPAHWATHPVRGNYPRSGRISQHSDPRPERRHLPQTTAVPPSTCPEAWEPAARLFVPTVAVPVHYGPFGSREYAGDR